MITAKSRRRRRTRYRSVSSALTCVFHRRGRDSSVTPLCSSCPGHGCVTGGRSRPSRGSAVRPSSPDSGAPRCRSAPRAPTVPGRGLRPPRTGRPRRSDNPTGTPRRRRRGPGRRQRRGGERPYNGTYALGAQRVAAKVEPGEGRRCVYCSFDGEPEGRTDLSPGDVDLRERQQLWPVRRADQAPVANPPRPLVLSDARKPRRQPQLRLRSQGDHRSPE